MIAILAQMIMNSEKIEPRFAAGLDLPYSAYVKHNQPNAIVQPGSSGGGGFVDHAAAFDVTIAEFVERPHTDNRVATRADGSTEKVGASKARFKVIDSTMHSPGEVLDVVWMGPVATDPSMAPSLQPPVGQKYLLVSYPQVSGSLQIVYEDVDRSTKLQVARSMPSGSPSEELSCQILMTDSDRLDRDSSPIARLALSALDCIRIEDHLNRTSSYNFLKSVGYPQAPAAKFIPLRHPSPIPENAVTLAMRKEATAGKPDVCVTIMQILSSWGFRDTGLLTLQGQAGCARDINAFVPSMGDQGLSGIAKGAVLGAPSFAAYVVSALSGAVNPDAICNLLKEMKGAKPTIEEDRRISFLLDFPKADVRYYAACHFAESRNRPDLTPTFPDIQYISAAERAHPGEGRQDGDAYPDLVEKVAAWKQFFGIS